MPTLTRRLAAGVLSAALLAGLLLAGGPYAGTAYACSCISTPLKEEIKRSDAVFSGEVRSIDEGATLGDGGNFTEPTGKITLAVRDSWKGPAAETVDVYGQGDGANCYNLFEKGEAYVVYASRGEGAGASAPLENNACGATKPLQYAGKDLRVLGPTPGGLAETGGPPLPLAGGVSLAAALFLILLAGALLDRVRR